MKLLLGTQFLLWAAGQPERLSSRFEWRVLRRGLLDNGCVELPVTSEHAARLTAVAQLACDRGPIRKV